MKYESSARKGVVLVSAATVVILGAAACSSVFQSDRNPAATRMKYGSEAIPSGLHGQDAADFEHLSEGSDIYPYEWMMALKSVNFKDANKQVTQPFYSDLDQRFGVIPSHNKGQYLMDYVGMTASWSNHPPDQSDALASDRNVKVRSVRGIKSIKLVGTNCAMCHNGEVRFNGTPYRLDGAPNMVNVRAYFQDLAQSTIGILAKEELMTAFLQELHVPEPQARAAELRAHFLKTLGEDTNQVGMRIGSISAFLTLALAKEGHTGRFYKAKRAISETLEKLLRLTYGIGEREDIGELRQRMVFLGTLMVGTDPRSKETVSGYNRTDAFGRIGNLVLRGTNPIGYTAPVSLPWIWGIKHMAMLHYAANTNSVALRNIGQSLGLGAIVLDPLSGRSTVNVHNLDRLEHLVHKIQVPRWEAVFANQPALRVNPAVASRGREIYVQKCQSCHETQEKVGPAKALYDYKMTRLDYIGTDPQAAKNIIVPVGEQQFQAAIYSGVEKIKSGYYERYGYTPEMQAALEFRSLRGYEFFRDTMLGYNEQDHMGNSYGNIQPGNAYKARHLAGVWATAPYLHNGSVPSMWDLLLPGEQRPKIFNVQSKEFDPFKLGFNSERSLDWRGRPAACEKKEERCFDTSLAGNGNLGHEYGTDLGNEDKKALIEYLKVLPPEPEYAWQ